MWRYVSADLRQKSLPRPLPVRSVPATRFDQDQSQLRRQPEVLASPKNGDSRFTATEPLKETASFVFHTSFVAPVVLMLENEAWLIIFVVFPGVRGPLLPSKLKVVNFACFCNCTVQPARTTLGVCGGITVVVDDEKSDEERGWLEGDGGEDGAVLDEWREKSQKGTCLL